MVSRSVVSAKMLEAPKAPMLLNSLCLKNASFFILLLDLIDIESYEENMSECDGPLIPQ